MKKDTIIYADRLFGSGECAVAESIIRFAPERIAAVLDRNNDGKFVQEILGYGGDIPFISGIDDFNAEYLILGAELKQEDKFINWIETSCLALEKGFKLYNMNPLRHSDKVKLDIAAKKGKTEILDFCYRGISNFPNVLLRKEWEGKVILTVGTGLDSCKLTTSIEIVSELNKRGKKAVLASTGPAGIFLTGRGLAFNYIPSNELSRAAEDLVISYVDNSVELIIVEGQGALNHPYYSPVAAALIHGCRPDGMIFCHRISESSVPGYHNVKINDIPKLVKLHEQFASASGNSTVLGLSLDCSSLNTEDTKGAIKESQVLTRLPASEPLKFGCSQLVRSIEEMGYME